ncbi:MAG: hypothetical protein V3U99_04380 [Alphaproteobacteria bacterium]
MNAITSARLLAALIPAVVLAATPKIAHAELTENECRNLYSSWYQYFERKNCVEEARKAEETRRCISKDLQRMESLAAEIKNGIREKMSLADAKRAMQAILGRELPIVRARDDAQDRVINTQITTDCASAFQFVIQLRAAPSGALRYVKMWSKFPPSGYPDGYRPALSGDFEGDRRRRQIERRRRAAEAMSKRARNRLRAEVAKRRARDALRKSREAEAAKIRRAEELSQRRKMLALRKLEALAGPPPEKDHCAPNLAKRERIRRLRLFGMVRRVGDNTFRAGAHGIGFAAKGAGLLFCR